MGRGIFRTLQPFDDFHIGKSPRSAGVYIIYQGETPVYVGRSRVNIRQRLEAHRQGKGNWFLRLVGPTAAFEYSEMMSCEQAEAQLIRELKTKTYGNYRFETDPELLYLKHAVQRS